MIEQHGRARTWTVSDYHVARTPIIPTRLNSRQKLRQAEGKLMRHTVPLVLALIGCAAMPAKAAPTFPDRGRAGVVDAAGVIPDDEERALNERVVAWDRKTGHQLVVATVPDMQGLDIKDYGYQLGRAWGLGDKQRNDGAILLLAMEERKVRIEVGYGLEPVLTDAATSAILADAVVPNLKAGNRRAHHAATRAGDRRSRVGPPDQLGGQQRSTAAPRLACG